MGMALVLHPAPIMWTVKPFFIVAVAVNLHLDAVVPINGDQSVVLFRLLDQGLRIRLQTDEAEIEIVVITGKLPQPSTR